MGHSRLIANGFRVSKEWRERNLQRLGERLVKIRSNHVDVETSSRVVVWALQEEIAITTEQVQL